MEKTYSQKVARAFEILDYLLLIPAGFGVFAASLLIGDLPWLPLAVYAVFIIGFVLLIGYFKHSRGRLKPERISALWIATAVFNTVFLLPALIYAAAMYQNLTVEKLTETPFEVFLPLFCVFAYGAAVAFSLKAYSSGKRQSSVLPAKLNSQIPQ